MEKGEVRHKENHFIRFVFLILSATGCQNRPEAEPAPKPLEDFYQADWGKMDRIEIRNGATGELKTFKEKELLRKWIDEARSIKITPDPSQEKRKSFRYSANLYEGDQLKFAFTDSQIGNVYILPSEQLHNQLKSLFES
ncbi:hypothetical protein [Paenibacillus chitinolyticus]|uniref:hypothetical protein n=1 Tax=Paenibacillus chitinolyticus TaxID=79263 RepID=UPI00367241BA